MEITQWIVDYPLKFLCAAAALIIFVCGLMGCLILFNVYCEKGAPKEVKHVRKEK